MSNESLNNDEKQIELKPCPFCGNASGREPDKYGVYVWQERRFDQRFRKGKWIAECRNCGVDTGCDDTQQEAIASWNTRVPILSDDRVREKAQAQTVWVVERFGDGNGKSLGYWTGHNSRDFTPNIIDAMQFARRGDALLAKSSWHWHDWRVCEATEHSYILAGEGARERVTVEHCLQNPDRWVVLLDGANPASGIFFNREQDANRYAAGLRAEIGGKA